MKTKYYRQDGNIVRCTDLKTFRNTEDFLLDEVRILESQLAEAREELGKEIKKAQDFEFAYKHTYDLKCYWEMQYNKLKEKGNR